MTRRVLEYVVGRERAQASRIGLYGGVPGCKEFATDLELCGASPPLYRPASSLRHRCTGDGRVCEGPWPCVFLQDTGGLEPPRGAAAALEMSTRVLEAAGVEFVDGVQGHAPPEKPHEKLLKTRTSEHACKPAHSPSKRGTTGWRGLRAAFSTTRARATGARVAARPGARESTKPKSRLCEKRQRRARYGDVSTLSIPVTLRASSLLSSAPHNTTGGVASSRVLEMCGTSGGGYKAKKSETLTEVMKPFCTVALRLDFYTMDSQHSQLKERAEMEKDRGEIAKERTEMEKELNVLRRSYGRRRVGRRHKGRR
ncbi:hypothetical protein FB451DRAFT_1362813 [Mycena latifolia]|nr:hypothetical protein FB451DRAFT_1362813 [Mycena latifolia]